MSLGRRCAIPLLLLAVVASADAQVAPPAGLVRKAEVLNVSPMPLVPGEPFLVTVGLRVDGAASRATVAGSLRVLINAVPAENTSPEQKSPAPTDADRPQNRFAEAEMQVTLFGKVPMEVAPRANQISPPMLGVPATLTVYSQIDGREIVSQQVTVTEPRTQAGPAAAAAEGKAAAAVPLVLFNLAPWQWALIGVTIMGMAAVAMMQRRNAAFRISELEARVQLEQHRLNKFGTQEGEAVDEAVVAGTTPTLPGEVFDALAAGDLVVVLGPGASAISGLPTSRVLWLDVLDRLGDDVPPHVREGLRGLVAADQPDGVIEPLLSFVGRDRLIAELAAQLVERPVKPSRLHQLLVQLPVRTIIDLNWDDLLIKALPAAKVFTPDRPQGVSEAQRAGEKTIIKPFGTLREPQSVALTSRELRLALSKSPELDRAIAALFSSRSLLFLGSTLKALEPILATLPPELEGGPRRHVAVVPQEAGLDLWEAGLGRRCGIRLVPYRRSADYRELVRVVEALGAHLASGAPGAEDPARIREASTVASVELTQIGLFPSITVTMSPGWTLMLGDNGGGKSTILRSIALALAGNEPRAVSGAARLLRAGARDGEIKLQLGNRWLVTTLVRDGAQVKVGSRQVTPLQAGELLVLAFPALRGVTTKQPKGPTALAAEDPSVSDILPILDGTFDTRLDNLKQWVVNTVLRAETSKTGREGRMLATFAALIAEMVPGGGLTFGRVDRATWQVYLNARPDSEVPFDAVSQGMSSILNWIGVLLQRLYDVYPRSEKPELESAIVLIDEIDAHLHPKWQRQLVALTRKHFPNIQVIASSHSPLLAGAVKRDELRVVARDASGVINALPPPEDLEGQKAEDILVSSIFELPTTRNVEAERTINRYFQLYQKLTLSKPEQKELDELAIKVGALNYGPTQSERTQLAKVQTQALADIDAISPEDARAVKALMPRTPEVES